MCPGRSVRPGRCEKRFEMPVQKTINKGRVPVHVWTDDIEAVEARAKATIYF